MKIERNKEESYLSFVTRITAALNDGLIDYQQWGRAVVGEDLYSEESTRRIAKFFSQFIQNLENDEIELIEDKDKVNEIKQLLEELAKERKKIQTANVEYNANLRSEARAEMFNEQVIEAIHNLKPIKFNKKLYIESTPEATAVLCIADAHNGVEINMASLFGEVVNVYSPEILKARLNKLANQVIEDKKRLLDYDKLIVFDLGDAIQGMLRLSDLSKLRTGVLQSALDYAEMIAQWLVFLSEELEVPIEYVCLGGNHCECRFLEKGRNWEEENLGLVIQHVIALRLQNNPNITVDPYSEFGFKTVQGVNILAIHGDDAKNDFDEISYWENYHNISIDILIMGHVHHGEQNTVGYGLTGDKEVIKVPSLVGVDSFSKKCRKLARAGAKFMLFEDGSKTWEKTIVLN